MIDGFGTLLTAACDRTLRDIFGILPKVSICFWTIYFKPAMASSADTTTLDSIWQEIELSERYLVSNMFHKAAETASAIVSLLCAEGNLGTESHNTSSFMAADRMEMIEAAAMVLLQSCNAIANSANAFESLTEKFGSILNIPPSIFLHGVCLLLANGEFSTARSALEIYLNGLDKGSDNLCFWTTGKTYHLDDDEYSNLCEIYTVHVLTKGYGNPLAAFGWLNGSDLSEIKKDVIAEKIHKLAEVRIVGSPQRLETEVPEPSHLDRISTLENTEAEANACTTKHSGKLEFIKAATMWPKASLQWSALVDSWLRRSLSRRAILLLAGGSAISFLLLYAFAKRWHWIKRIIMNVMQTTKTSLADFWELAFGLQINPLAAVQATPSSRPNIAR